jgi:Immunity protein 53
MGNDVVSEALAFLEQWFLRHCDGDWEHDTRIEISTLDNPGWYLTVFLSSSELEDFVLDYSVFRDDQPTWVHCWSDGQKFEAAAGPLGLTYAIDEFRNFASGDPMPGKYRVERNLRVETQPLGPKIQYRRPA